MKESIRNRIASVVFFFIPLMLLGYPALAITSVWLSDRDEKMAETTAGNDSLRAQLTYAVAHRDADRKRAKYTLDLGDDSTIDSDMADRVHAVFARYRVGWSTITPDTNPTANAALTSTGSTRVGVKPYGLDIVAQGDFKSLAHAVADLPRGHVLSEVTRFTIRRLDPNDASRNPALQAHIGVTYYTITARPAATAPPAGAHIPPPAATSPAPASIAPTVAPTSPPVARPTEQPHVQ